MSSKGSWRVVDLKKLLLLAEINVILWAILTGQLVNLGMILCLKPAIYGCVLGFLYQLQDASNPDL